MISLQLLEYGVQWHFQASVTVTPRLTDGIDDPGLIAEVGVRYLQALNTLVDLQADVVVPVRHVRRPHVTDAKLAENDRLPLRLQDYQQGVLRRLVTFSSLIDYFQKPCRIPLPLDPGKLKEPVAMWALQVLPGVTT